MHWYVFRLCINLFHYIFENGIVSSVWLRAIINPIPKGSGKDPYVPINYRGISLLSCISKCYTSIMNERLVRFCDENQILVDEQNGFRKHRSCNGHLFSLTSIIRNRLATNMSLEALPLEALLPSKV